MMKMACGIKTIYSIGDLRLEKTRVLLLNALVISHLQYPSVLLNGITKNLLKTFGNQLCLAVKAGFKKQIRSLLIPEEPTTVAFSNGSKRTDGS